MQGNFQPIEPIPHPLAAQVCVPGSKSQTNRALLLAALSDGVTNVKDALFSEDTMLLSGALKELGFLIDLNPTTKRIMIHGLGGYIPSSDGQIDVGNAGTAARFLTAFLTLGSGSYHLDGSTRMRQRPIGDLVLALTQLGAEVIPESPQPMDYITPPLTIKAKGLLGGRTSIRGEVSSQFLSAILMVAPYAQEPVDVKVESNLNSRPYVDLTLGVMEDFGVKVQQNLDDCFRITPQRYVSPVNYQIEADASSASYFFAAPAICGGWVKVNNITRNTLQGDIGFLDILSKMGCEVVESGSGIKVSGANELRGVDVNMKDISDTALTLAAIAPFANSPTSIRGIFSSRYKETDRIKATCIELKRLGVKVEEKHDGLKVFPCNRIAPARIRTYQDHRIAMAFSLVGLGTPGIEIENPECVAKTFPNFIEVLESLR